MATILKSDVFLVTGRERIGNRWGKETTCIICTKDEEKLPALLKSRNSNLELVASTSLVHYEGTAKRIGNALAGVDPEWQVIKSIEFA